MSRVCSSKFTRYKLVIILGVLLLGASLGTSAFAHATLVLGALGSNPAAPREGEPFTLRLELLDPTQVPVEDAWILAEFRPQGAPTGTEPVSARFEESETPGVYQTRVTLPQRGSYALLLRDQTFRQEEAQASLSFPIGRAPAELLTFVFPPTATGPQSLRVWLLWLVGLPLLAAVIITILVLTQKQGGEAKDAETRERQT